MKVELVSTTPDAEKTMAHIARVSIQTIKIIQTMQDY